MANHSPATGSERRVFPLRLEILPETAALVEAWCSGRGVGSEHVARLVLIVEELLTNTVMHGHGGAPEAPGASVALTLVPHARGIELIYEDLAPPYDPTPHLAGAYAPIEDKVEDRPVGGLGLRLVGQFAAATRYAYENGSNRLWLVVEVAA